MATQTELEERARQFLIRLMKLAGTLAQSPAAFTAQDLVEAGRAVAANYRAAIRAETHADFVERVEQAASDAAEASRLLETCRDLQPQLNPEITGLLDEASQLLALLVNISRKAKDKS